MQNLQIWYIFVVHAEVVTTFLILQHFATKLCNFTNLKMLVLAVVVDFVLLA